MSCILKNGQFLKKKNPINCEKDIKVLKFDFIHILRKHKLKKKMFNIYTTEITDLEFYEMLLKELSLKYKTSEM